MDTWLIPLDFLEGTQKAAVVDLENRKSIIIGPPGSGKTQVLLHRAAFLKKRYEVSTKKYQVFVFTNSLKNFLMPELDLLGLDGECISTFDSWCYRFYKKNISKKAPWNKKKGVPDFEKIRMGVFEYLKKMRIKNLFTFLVVDEAQDFSEEVIEIFDILSENIMVAFDPRQQIYENGSSLDSVKRIFKSAKTYYLEEGYRCSRSIKDLASALLEKDSEKVAFEREYRRTEGPVEKPLLFFAANYEEERERLFDIVKVRMSKGENIGVLFPDNRRSHGFAKGFEEEGIRVIVGKKLLFDEKKPKIIPYRGSKGLVFDTVLLPRLVRGFIPKSEKAMMKKLLFVAITRARKWVYLSTIEGQEMGEVMLLKPLAKNNLIQVQKSETQQRLKLFDDDWMSETYRK